jgi:hypothetical protein
MPSDGYTLRRRDTAAKELHNRTRNNMQSQHERAKMLHHPDNDHWHEWREAVKRTGYTKQLSCASDILQELETLTAQEFESYCACLWERVAA